MTNMIENFLTEQYLCDRNQNHVPGNGAGWFVSRFLPVTQGTLLFSCMGKLQLMGLHSLFLVLKSCGHASSELWSSFFMWLKTVLQGQELHQIFCCCQPEHHLQIQTSCSINPITKKELQNSVLFFTLYQIHFFKFIFA